MMTAVLVLDAWAGAVQRIRGFGRQPAGCNPFISSLIGVMTGVFGGVLRDIICNEIPPCSSGRNSMQPAPLSGPWNLSPSDRVLIERILCGHGLYRRDVRAADIRDPV